MILCVRLLIEGINLLCKSWAIILVWLFSVGKDERAMFR